MQHKESNRNFGARKYSQRQLNQNAHTHSKMYNLESMDIRQELNTSASKALAKKMSNEVCRPMENLAEYQNQNISTSQIQTNTPTVSGLPCHNLPTQFISMPLTERGRHQEKPQKSSKERRSSRRKSKDVCHCVRHPQKRIKYFCEPCKMYMCTSCKKDHKGPQHLVKQFKIDMKKMRSEVLNMLKEYHGTVNQLLTSKQNLSEKLTEFDAKLQVEVDSINSAFSRVIENLTKHKNMLLDELKGSMKYRVQQTQDQFERLCGQIDRMKEAWTDLNSFNNQIGKQSYEHFSQIKIQNNKELHQSKCLVESAINF